MQGKNNCEKGTWAENIAVDYILKNNYEILERNYRTKFGEIDIIAKNYEYITFIEVKYRKNFKYGYPREAVNYYKQRKIYKVALWYISENNLNNKNFRFDVIEVYGKNYDYKINLLKNAFQV